jgi:hypothetical protein
MYRYGNNFTIQATAASGVAPYTYSNMAQTLNQEVHFNVAPGTYTVTIKDNNGCTSTATPLIVYPTLTSAATTKQLIVLLVQMQLLQLHGGGKGIIPILFKRC